MAVDVRHELVKLLPRLRRFAYSLSGSLEEADDIVQACCERALSRLHQFEPGTRLDSWMFRIVQNEWLGRLRTSGRRKYVSDAEIAESMSFDARIPEQIEARKDLAVVFSEVDRLPPEQRVVLALVAIDGHTYQEAADLLAIPIGTVMSRLSRARVKLAEAIEKSHKTRATSQGGP